MNALGWKQYAAIAVLTAFFVPTSSAPTVRGGNWRETATRLLRGPIWLARVDAEGWQVRDGLHLKRGVSTGIRGRRACANVLKRRGLITTQEATDMPRPIPLADVTGYV